MILSFKQYLNEMPVPDDWDTNIFQQSFKKQIDYALEKSQRLGQGSSRVAFIIPYKGRETVLKIAKNANGLAQNQREADYGLHHMHGSVLAPLIDHDEENDPPRWIQFEKAEKMTPAKFKQITGFNFEDFGNMLMDWEQELKGGRRSINYKYNIPEEVQQQIQESELFDEVTQMVSNFDFLMGDFTRTANWGIYKGQPVIIDYGFDESIQKQYYTPKKQVRW